MVLTEGLTVNHFLVNFAFYGLVMYTCITLGFLWTNTIMDYCEIYLTCSKKEYSPVWYKPIKPIACSICRTELGFFWYKAVIIWNKIYITMTS